ncbi:MAG: hypothetical protein IV100_04255 [Myxococcales bacterium]|nr:hypothetical protein [Myxococcales bacterium]
MRLMKSVRHAGFGAMAALIVSGCGLVPVKLPVSAPTKDFASDAAKAMTDLKAEYTLAKGLAALVQTKVDEFLYIEDGLKLGKVQWKQFRDELESCWNAPVETAEGIQARVIKAEDAAAAFQGNAALHEVQAVKDAGWNAVNKVKACPGALKEDVTGLPKKATDEAKAWARTKLEILNELRVLAKEEAPARAKSIGPKALDAAKSVGTQLAGATAHLATIEKLGDQKANDFMKDQIAKLNAMKSEAEQLSSQVQTDSVTIGTQSADAGKRIAEGFVAIGKRK